MAVDYSVRTGGVQVKFRDLNGDGRADLLYATAINAAPMIFILRLIKAMEPSVLCRHGA